MHKFVTYFLIVFLFPVTGSFVNTMRFVSKDCDPSTGESDGGPGYDDEYVVCSILLICS